MKINITGLEGQQEIDINQIPDIVDGSCSEIRVGDLLDHVEYESQMTVLDTILSKVRYGGTVHFAGVDIYQIAHSLTFGVINSQKAIQTLFSNNHKSATCMSTLIDQLNSRGFTVATSEIYHQQYVISAKKFKHA
jgi:threonine dehydrogenase-like Zn-dependent dehydrogenase